MEWIRVTPETMPNERQYVLVTYIDCLGGKCVDPDCLFEGGKFKRYDFHWEEYVETDDVVTHWIPCPKPAEDCNTEEDCIPTPHLIDATTSRDINSGRYPVYVLGFGVSEDDLTDDERTLLEQSKRWMED